VPILPLIPKRFKEMLEIIDGKEPNIKIGNFCKSPYECPIMDECWKFLPENHVFELYRGNKQAMELFEKGILAIKDIPEEVQKLINKRESVRATGDYQKADKLREQIKNLGFVVEDTASGQKISKL